MVLEMCVSETAWYLLLTLGGHCGCRTCRLVVVGWIAWLLVVVCFTTSVAVWSLVGKAVEAVVVVDGRWRCGMDDRGREWLVSRLHVGADGVVSPFEQGDVASLGQLGRVERTWFDGRLIWLYGQFILLRSAVRGLWVRVMMNG